MDNQSILRLRELPAGAIFKLLKGAGAGHFFIKRAKKQHSVTNNIIWNAEWKESGQLCAIPEDAFVQVVNKSKIIDLIRKKCLSINFAT